VHETRCSLGWLPKASRVTKQSAQGARSRRVCPQCAVYFVGRLGRGACHAFAVLRVSHRIGVKRITRFIDGQALSARSATLLHSYDGGGSSWRTRYVSTRRADRKFSPGKRSTAPSPAPVKCAFGRRRA